MPGDGSTVDNCSKERSWRDGSTVENCNKERDPGEMVPLLTTAIRRKILERWFHC
jgi:hypothetical protein